MLLAAQGRENLTAGKCQRGRRARGLLLDQASNRAHDYVSVRAEVNGRPGPDRRRPLGLVTLPRTHVGIRVCDELKPYKIGQGAGESARSGPPIIMSVKE